MKLRTRLTLMARIIGGSLGSLRLKPAASVTRPTSDRVKESLFGILESRGELLGARVVDLFAGSGALGLEAASRGAAAVTLVERDSTAQKVLEANIESVLHGLESQGLRCKITLLKKSAERVEPIDCDLLFIDPPYELSDANLAKLLDPWLKLLPTVVIERSKSSLIENLIGLNDLDVRSYGETKLIIGYSDRSATPV